MGLFSWFKRKKKNKKAEEANTAPVTADSDTPVLDAEPVPADPIAKKDEPVAEEPAVEDTPAEDAPVADAEPAVEDTPAEDSPVADAEPAVEDTPAEDAPVADAEPEAKEEKPAEKPKRKSKPKTANVTENKPVEEPKEEPVKEEAAPEEKPEEDKPEEVKPVKYTGRFEINKTKDGKKYFFNLYASNKVGIATSQMYSSAQNALNGVKSVIANAPKALIEDQTLKTYETLPFPKWEIYLDNGGKYRFRLDATNGSCVCHSQGYTSKTNCKNGIESIIRSSRNAEIDKAYLIKKDNQDT